jgi:2-methylisocitrate lyase-like PEP mutase family enzyme
MEHINIGPRAKWREVLAAEKPLQLPAAPDGLTAKIIWRSRFKAMQLGGFAHDGQRYGVPDIDLLRFAEKRQAVAEVMAASPLPILIDCDDGYGDVKNVTFTVMTYEAMHASAIFIEDQVSPKRCGHMSGKHVLPMNVAAEKIRAACAARRDPDSLFIIARTDAIATDGVREALSRAERYLKAGADGVFIEGPENLEQLKEIGRETGHVPTAANMLEGGGKTPWVSPAELGEMGFSMVFYPTTILFQVAKMIQRACATLRAGLPMPNGESVTMDEFEKLVEMDFWKGIEERYPGGVIGESGFGGSIKSIAKKLVDPFKSS